MKTGVCRGGLGPRLESLEPRLLLAADVVISEIMYQAFTDPDAGRPEDYGEEFIELHNRGDAPADLLGWKFTDGIAFEFPDVAIGAGEHLVVAANPAAFHTIYPTIANYVSDYGWEGHLSNSGERIALEDDSGEVVDQVKYADEGDWAVRERLPDPEGGSGYVWSNLHDGGGRSLELINREMTNNCGQNWSASLLDGGTPGEPNSVAADDIAPLIRNVEHFPIIPTALEKVTVRAKIQDELATGVTAVLHYRDDGDPTFNTATMYDDGLHDDGDPGDDVYAGEIPERPDGTIVEFYVQATDAGANSRTWPAPVAARGQVANCLYQVDDSFTEDWTPGSQPVWRVILTAAEWAYLDNLEDTQRWSNAQMNATFITTDGVSTKVRYEAGMRNRGNGSRTHDPHNQRINIPHDRPWQGYTAVTMNTQRAHSQIIASAVFRYADVPAADATAVKFLINGVDHADAGSDMYGHYVALEALDSDLAANHWPDDDAGDLYKCNDSNGPAAADLDYDGENPDNYNIAYVKQTNVAADDYSGLIHMLYVLNEAPEETYLQDVAEVIDIEQWVRFLAVDTLLANGEGGLTDGRGDDYAMYQGVKDPRFTLVPYDLDTVLGTGSQSQTNDDIWEYRDPSLHGLERLLSQPEVAQMYYAQLLELCDTVFSPEILNPLIDQALAWAPAAIRGNMKTFAMQRVAYVRGQVANDPLSVQSSLPVSGGYPRTTDGTVGLSGTASGAHTRSVLLNGQLAEWDPENGDWWFDEGAGSYEEQTLVTSDAAVTYHVPTDGEDPLTWTELTFDDSTWVTSITLDAAGVLITEISTGATRFVEIENVSGQAIDTTGWLALVNDAPGGVNAVNTVAWSLPGSIAAGEVLYQSDDVADHYWGATIDWGPIGPGWAMIVDDAGGVRDFLAWGYTAAEIASLDIAYGGFTHITVGDEWSGDGAPVGTADTEVPTADIIDVSPDPRNAAVSQIEIVFSEAVSGFDLSDLSLTRDGGGNLLTAEDLSTTDDITWTLGGLAGLTGASGTYTLALTAAGSGIQDATGNPLAGDASDTWLTDADAPTADVIDVAPDPHNAAVSQIEIVFSEAVSGLDVSDLSLTRDGGANLLTGSQSVGTSDNVTWALGDLSGLTSAEGTYTLTLTAAASGIQDAAGNPLAADASDTWEVVGVPPTADIVDVSPDPRNTPVDEIEIVFTEAVSGFDITDLRLRLDGGANLLTAEALSSGDNITWTLGGLAGLTAADGTYTLTLTAAGSGIQDAAGNPLADDASDVWVMNTQMVGWVAFNDHVAGPGTHVNATTYAGNGTSFGELKDIDTGAGTGATLTITASAIVYDNNGANPPNPSDAYSYFNGFVDMSASTGTSIEVEGGLGAFYTHTFSGLDTGALATYDFVGAAIRGSNTYTNRWTLITLVGADGFISAHSTGDGVVTSAFNPALADNQVVIWAGDNGSPGQGWVAHWTDIDPGTDGGFAVVSQQYTGPIPTSVDAGGVADGAKTYGIIGIRLAEVPTKAAPSAAPAAAGPAPAKDGGFVAYNDHLPGGGTHANTTDYSAMSGEAHSGVLKDIATGADTTVTLEVTAAGINYQNSQANPASGTDAYEIFHGFVDFGSATGASLELTAGDHYTYTFSDLDVGDAVTYNFAGTAIRGNSGYTDRWTLVTLVGADASTSAHSSGNGVVVISPTQMALWTGANHLSNQGFVAAWTDIDPGTDGEFLVVSRQYEGPTPGVGSGNSTGGDKGYGLTGIRLEEVAPSGPESWLKRMGNTDGNDADDFARSAADSKGLQNPDMTVPFGTTVPTTMGIGFSDGQPAFEAVIETDVGEAMENVNASLWSRVEFTAGDLPGYDALTLRMKYDDGFVAYLNGTEVARRNADNPLAWNTAASAEHPNAQAVLFEDIDISAFLDQLVVGANVLAIHGQNIAAGDADFLLQAELIASRGTPDPGLDLFPGLNRVVVQAFDGEYGTGTKLDETYIDIWSDTGPMNEYPRELGLRTNLIVRDSYLPGIPVLVRVEVLDESGDVYRELWDATATVSASSGIGLDVSQVTLYNGLGSAFVTFTGSGPFDLTVDVDGVTDTDSLVDLTGPAATEVSGTLSDPSGTDTWSGIIHVTGDVVVPSGHTLNVQPGTLVLIDGNPVPESTDGLDIDVQGAIQSLGTEAQPITFTAYDPAAKWGEIHHSNADPSTYQYTNVTLACHSPQGGHTDTGPAFRAVGSQITFDHASITDLAGKVGQLDDSDIEVYDTLFSRAVMGPELDHTGLLFQDSFIIDMLGMYREDGIVDDDDGIYVHTQSAGQEINLIRSVIAHGEDDGVDTAGATVLVQDTIIRDFTDKGISVSGGDTIVERAIITGHDIGIETKYDGAVTSIDRSTLVDNVNGVRLMSSGGGMTVTSSIIRGTSDSIYADNPTDMVISYSNVGEVWAGTGNIDTDPLFVDQAAHDYHLQPSSPSIDAGDPAAPADPDGSTIDQGYYTNQSSDVPQEGELAADTVWRPEDGQYRVLTDLTVPPQFSLTILPGTTVFFNNGAGLIVRGPLYAEGTAEAPIRFAPAPGASSWDGLQFVGNMNDNVIRHAILGGVHRIGGMIELVGSNLTLEHSTLEDATRRRIGTQGSSLIVRDCVFTDIFPGETPPDADNVCEHISGQAPATSGHFIIENNVFGTTKGHNDAIDVNGSASGPVIQILDNVFLGGGDDALDLEGDALVEGNVFTHFLKDQWNTGSGNANGISAGSGYHYVLVRNVYYDVDHVAQVKENSFMTFVNNTVTGVVHSAIYFRRPTGGAYGRGAYVEGSIFADTPLVFDELEPATDLVVNYSLVNEGDLGLGTGNLTGDARLADPAGGDFSLANGSPAIGTGPVGEDMGADVPAGALLSAVPASQTYLTDAAFQVSGDADAERSAILAYKYRLNGGGWSAEQTPGAPISLTGLTDGPQVLEVIAQNSAGAWQDEADANSASWTVDTALSRVLINEVLARNASAYDHEGTHPDIIELYNDSPAGVDISGWSITDNVDIPTKFVFPEGTTIAGEGYLLLFADDAATPTSGIHLDFGVKAGGDDVWLFDGDGAVVDSIEYGLQVTDLSIGRVGPDRAWALTQPTIDPTGAGSANAAEPVADPNGVLINEWFANGDVVLVDDFLELHNPDTLPVDVGGLYLTDNPANQKTKHEIRPLSFIAAEGFQALKADDRDDPGHMDFRLRALMEILGLFDAEINQMDRIYYCPQTEDVSQGRTPDGSDTIEFFTLPTPGVGNVTSGPTNTVSETLVAETDPEHVLVPTGDIGSTWRTDLVYDTSGWDYFQGTPPEVAVGYDSGDDRYRSLIGLDLEAEMDNTRATCYIRIPFTFTGDLSDVVELWLNVRYDDGFIAYLNGREIGRENFPATGTPQWNSEAETTHDDGLAVNLEPFDVSDYIGELDVGDNLLAIHALNAGVSSSDFLISPELVATVETSQEDTFAHLLALHNDLRITEIMYNPAGSEQLEFIELQNTGTGDIDLDGVRLSCHGGDPDAYIDFVFPEMTLEAGEYVVVPRDLSEFEDCYGTGLNAIDGYDFDGNRKLPNSGADILLQMPDPYDAAILRFEYDDDWYTPTDGDGPSLHLRDYVLPDHRAHRATWRDEKAWRPSQVDGGSPGEDEPAAELEAGAVVINEVLSHSDGYPNDWIEIRNTTDGDIDISGWYLSDDPAQLTKYRIADGTTLPARNPEDPDVGYMVFTQDDHFGAASSDPGRLIPFALNEHGDDVLLSSSNIGIDPGAYRNFVVFDATENGVSLGRHLTSTGRALFVAMSEPTIGPGPAPYANADPLVGPIVIEEIMYHPQEGEYEYLLLRNITGAAVELHDGSSPQNTWKFTEGITFEFPEDVSVPAGGCVLVTTAETAAYLAKYNVPANVQVFGRLGPEPQHDIGAFSNGGETITLSKPGAPETIPEPFVPYIIAESVKYNDNYPWPDGPDGHGPALRRLLNANYGNDAINWGFSGAPVVTVNPLVTNDNTPELTGTIADANEDLPATVTVTVDGIEYVAPVTGGTWTLADDTITPALADGTYDVAVSAYDTAGKEGSDQTTDELVVDASSLTAEAWYSAAEHGDVGEALLEIPDDGTGSEPRTAGVTRLRIDFSEAIDRASFTPESVALAGNDADGQPVDLLGIFVTTATAEGDTVGIIDFTPALPDVVRYLVRIDGVTDAGGGPLTGGASRIFTALAGDSSGDLRVNAIDLSYVWPRRTTLIDGVSADQTRSDVTSDGRINAIDLSAAWPRRGANMRDIPDPVLPPAMRGAGTSQGVLDAAAAFWQTAQAAASPAEADETREPLEASAASPQLPAPRSAEGLLSDLSGSAEPIDVLAAPAEGEHAQTPSRAAGVEADVLDVLALPDLAVIAPSA